MQVGVQGAVAHRLETPQSYDEFDAAPEAMLNGLSALAARLFQASMARITWFYDGVSSFSTYHGFAGVDMPHALLTHVNESVDGVAAPRVIYDTERDSRAASIPWLACDPRIRFYAETPLCSRKGMVLGTFTFCDFETRPFDSELLDSLTAFAALLVGKLELHTVTQSLELRSRELEQQTSVLKGILESAGEGIVVANESAHIVLVNPAAKRLSGCETNGSLQECPLSCRAFHADKVTPFLSSELPLHQALRGISTDKVEVFLRGSDEAPGSDVILSLTGRPIMDAEGKIRGGVVTFNDITEMKRSREQFEQLASTDPLTGLANKRTLKQRLDLLVAEGARGRRFAVIMVDIDHFKHINDGFGHQCGDEVLMRVAKALSGRVRSTDLVARYGGEEFCILLTDVDAEAAIHVADELRKVITAGDFPTQVTASFGVCAFSPRASSTEALMLGADRALYRAKNEGRNRVSIEPPPFPRVDADNASLKRVSKRSGEPYVRTPSGR